MRKMVVQWGLPIVILVTACNQSSFRSVSASERDKSPGKGGQDTDGRDSSSEDGDDVHDRTDGDDAHDAGSGADGTDDRGAADGTSGGGWDSDFLEGIKDTIGSDSVGDEGEGDEVSSGSGDGDGLEGALTSGGGLVVENGISGSASDVALRTPRFGLLANDVECGLCHVQVHGDLASIGDVEPLHGDTDAKVIGSWFVAGQFRGTEPNLDARAHQVRASAVVTATGSIESESRSDALPRDVDGDGKPDFPRFDPEGIAYAMNGRLTAPGVDVVRIHDGNLVLVGTEYEPIHVGGEVLVRGDLVIKGNYKGIGNIYVTGNVYIPGNLQAARSPFPFPDTPDEIREHAVRSLSEKDDALAIATKKSIILSDFKNWGQGNSSVFEHVGTPVANRAEALGVYDVFNWYPGGESGFAQLFNTFDLECGTGRGDNDRSFSRIDAFLFAERAIGGRANRNSFAINGGVIADHFHVISAAASCPAGIHPATGLDQQWSHISYDHRLRHGLLLLKQIRGSFN